MKDKIREWLINNNIAIVKAYYRGSGDEGYIDEIDFYDVKDNSLTRLMMRSLPDKPDLYDTLDSIISNDVYQRFPGWEINGGGSGYWEWNVNTGIIIYNHIQLIEECECYESTWNSVKIPDWIK